LWASIFFKGGRNQVSREELPNFQRRNKRKKTKNVKGGREVMWQVDGEKAGAKKDEARKRRKGQGGFDRSRNEAAKKKKNTFKNE